jgi:hypothetical protein
MHLSQRQLDLVLQLGPARGDGQSHAWQVDGHVEVGGRGGCAIACAMFTPLDITPTWLNACGKLPANSPVEGSICSGSSPRGLARAHNDE